MSAFLGNCCLGLASLIFISLIRLVLNYKPPTGGWGGPNAYGMLVLLFCAGILVLMALSAIAIGRNGGFDWVSDTSYLRFVVVAAGLLAAMIPFLYAAITLESPMSQTAMIRGLSRFALVAVPVILVGAGVVLLNAPIRQVCPAALYKWPLALAAASGLVIASLGTYEWWDKSRKTDIELQAEYENSAAIKAQRLKEIQEAQDPGDMLRMLEKTRIAFPAEVREAAVAKIKSWPDWPQKLLIYMENDYARDVIGFLAYNDVPDKKRFAEPLRKGVLATADWVRASIQATSPSDYSVHEFSDDANCVLLAVDRFEGLGTDFRPAVQAMREALDEPQGQKKLSFRASAILDEWLAKHTIH